MRLAFGAFATILFFAGCTTTTPPKETAEAALASASARNLAEEKPGYCIAVRGNGEREPAHWGALASTVEQLGIPKAMAGGSSATITMFFFDSMVSNPYVVNESSQVQKERASLLVKSLHGFFQLLQQTPAWEEVKSLYGHYQKRTTLTLLDKIRMSLDGNLMRQAKDTLVEAINLGLVDPATVKPLMDSIDSMNKNRAVFYVNELRKSAGAIGDFNAQSDGNLFFRAGVISFERASHSFGRIAGFYAADGDDEHTLGQWKNFFETCAPNSRGLGWPQILVQRPMCRNLFADIFHSHFKKDNSHLEDKMIGGQFAVYPSTAVLTGNAIQEFHRAQQKYHQSMSETFGENFHLSRPDDVRFGYWGDRNSLQVIASRLDPNDEKSRKFFPLGPTTWKQVLSLSPAEPGLAPLKDFTTMDGTALVSAGGWSDLQPVPVLKAAGCSDVVYLTRSGGESLFAQGVAKRLLFLNRDWSALIPSPAASRINDLGDRSDMNSNWSRLYNLANPRSSATHSLELASAVLCTNWNAYDVMKSFVPMIEDAYRSPFWINPAVKSTVTKSLAPPLQVRVPGCSPNQ
jgi:hypothetical protein